MASHPDQSRQRVVVISADVVSQRMAGPGIRCWELARVLASRCNVTLAAPNADVPRDSLVRVVQGAADRTVLTPLIESADVIVTDAWGFDRAGDIPATAHVVADLYDPYMLENLEWLRDRPANERHAALDRDIRLVDRLLERADFVICASERQRDFWLGMLTLAGRVNPDSYDADPSLATMVSVVPFGLPSESPRATGPFMRGVHPQIGPADPILLWGGGLWDWLDPMLLVRAMPAVIAVHPNARLIFPGVRHPNADLPDARARADCAALASRLALLERNVFFGDWVPYDRRADYLLEANIGVSLHANHLEARMAYRTRLLDYIWAGLPMIVTEGDVMADYVRARGLGEVIGYGDLEGLSKAILRLLAPECGREEFAHAMRCAAESLTWETAARPLLEYCVRPYHAPDRLQGDTPLANARRLERAQSDELRRLRTQVAGYEHGRVIRALNRIQMLRRKVSRQ